MFQYLHHSFVTGNMAIHDYKASDNSGIHGQGIMKNITYTSMLHRNYVWQV